MGRTAEESRWEHGEILRYAQNDKERRTRMTVSNCSKFSFHPVQYFCQHPVVVGSGKLCYFDIWVAFYAIGERIRA